MNSSIITMYTNKNKKGKTVELRSICHLILIPPKMPISVDSLHFKKKPLDDNIDANNLVFCIFYSLLEKFQNKYSYKLKKPGTFLWDLKSHSLSWKAIEEVHLSLTLCRSSKHRP